MVKMLLVILSMFAVVYGGIELFRLLIKSADKKQLTTKAVYATIAAVVTTLLLSTIVFLF